MRSRPLPLCIGAPKWLAEERWPQTPGRAAKVCSIAGGAVFDCVRGHTLPVVGRARRLSLAIAFRKRPNWIKVESFAIHCLGVFARPDAHLPTMADCPAATFGGGIGRSRQCPAAA